MNETHVNGALKGIKILDFSQLLAGPYGAMMLGDMGAEVIKIERIETGDLYRGMTFGNQYIHGQVSPTFLAWNRNKQSLSMDLKDPQVKEVIYDMVKQSDIVIHNFRPGVMEKLGYGYDVCRQLNKGIIYASNSGFGETGPYAERPGQDLLAQGLSGIMSLIGRKGSPPTPLGTGIADHLAAYHMVYGILTALYYREKTGLGQKVQVNLFASMLAFMNQEMLTIMNTDIQLNKPDSGIGLPFLEAPYGVYACRDGYITIAMNDFAKLVKVLGNDELLKYQTQEALYNNRDTIFHAIEAMTSKKSKAHWLKVMLDEDLWVSEVKDIRDVEHDPQVKHMEMMTTYHHEEAGEIKVVGPAVTMSETPADITQPPPMVGEHSVAILKRYGVDEHVIQSMIDRSVVYTSRC